MSRRDGIDSEFDALRALVNGALERALSAGEIGLSAQAGAPPILAEAMRYAVLGGGKRMRPLLVLSAAAAVGGTRERALPAACGIELIHAYSLVHDDLPAMDDDDERRGRPTVHVKYGESTAILAGDGLLSEAFRVLADPTWSIADRAKLRIVALMATASGAAGMVGGQEHDMRAATDVPSIDGVRRLHVMKTGALFHAAALAGGIAAGASLEQERALIRYGEAVGRAFQLTDDVLDLEADAATSGDEHEDRVNLAVRLGRAQALGEASDAVDVALAAANTFGDSGGALRHIAEFIATRKA